MRKSRLKSNMKIIGIKNFHRSDRKIDYYLIDRSQERLYAFSTVYTRKAYEICKSGIMVNDLAGKRCRDFGVMRLVNQLNRMLPYLAELYDLPLAA